MTEKRFGILSGNHRNLSSVKIIMDTFFETKLAAPFIISLLLWVRGLSLSNRSYLIFSIMTLIFASFHAMIVVMHSGFISYIGFFLFIFGVITLILKKKAIEGKALSKRGADLITFYLILTGMISQFII